MSDLRPCPFCGTKHIDDPISVGPGLEVVVMPHGTAWVKCWECNYDGPAEVSGTKNGIADRAIALWNTRASDAQAEKLAVLLRESAVVLLSKNAGHQVGMSSQIDAALAAYDASKENP